MMELISRELAIDYMRVLGGEDRERLMGILNNKNILPTIESRPKGKWLEDTGLYATCSNCKENLYQAIEYKFCPNCGAEMEGAEEGE